MMPNEHTAPEVVAELLRHFDIGTDPHSMQGGPWPVYVGQLLLDPDNAISVADNSIPTQGRLHPTGETQGPEGFQIRVRATDYNTGKQKIWEVRRKFDEIVRFQIAVGIKLYLVQAIHQNQTPTYMGADPNNRYSFVLNCITSISEVLT